MLCESCGHSEFIEGTLEGVSFEPARQQRKRITHGVYGIKAVVCLKCGRIAAQIVDVDALGKILRE